METMKEHIIYQRLYGLIVMLNFIFLSDTVSVKGKKLDFSGRGDKYVSLINTIPELSRFTVCIDLVLMEDNSSYWMAFSYVTNNTFLGREDIDLGLAGDRQQLILYNLGRTFYIHYQLTPSQWHTICLIWDCVKGRLELFLNKEGILLVMDQPQNLTPNGTLILGNFLKNGDSRVKNVVPRFNSSLYYFQLGDCILENEEFMKCLDGTVVSWEENIWLIHKIIPTVDRMLHCFVSENMTIQEMSTSLSQQVELTTLSQITGLESRSSTVMSKSMSVFANDYTTTSYFYTTSPSLETMTAPKLFKTSMVETATLAAEVLSASAYFTLPTQSTSTGKTTNSIKITIVLPSESASTTKMTGAMDTETFYPTMATNFPTTSGFIKNSIMSQTLAIESQSAIMRPTSLSSTIESISTSTTSWPKHRTIDIGALSTVGWEFLASAAAGDTSWSIVEQTSSTTAHIGTASTFPSESVLTSTVALGDSVFPRNQTASTLATADTEIAFSVHLVTLPTRPSQITPSLRTTKPESTTVNVQGISSPTVEGAMSNSMSEKISFMALSFVTPSTFTGTQSSQPGINSEPTHIALSPGIPFTPTMAETILSPTSTRPIHTQNTITGGEHMITLISSRSVSTSKASESNLTSITDEYAHLFSTNETTWTAKPDQKSMKTANLLTFVPSENFTSASHGSTTNTEHSSTATKIITPPEASTEGVATSTTDATTGKYTVALSKLTSPWFANFSTVPGTPSVTNTSEFKLTTLPLKSSFMSTVVANELSLITKGTIVPPVGIISTLANVKPNFSTKDSPSETTQTETNGTSTFGDTTVPVPKSATTRRLNATMTKEIISPYLKGKSTISAITEVSPFSTMLEATDESAQMITASVSVFPFPVIEKLTTPSGNKPATIEVKESWLSTKLMNSTPKNSYNATTEIFNSIHIYSKPWTSETPEGNSNPSLNPGNTQTFPEALGASTTRIFGISFTTTPIDKSAMSLSASILPPWSSATLPSATLRPVSHMSSLPVNVSAVTSMMVSDKMKVTMPEPSTLARPLSISVLSDVLTLSSATKTKALVPPLAQTVSTPNDTLPTHSDSIHTTTMTSARLTLIEVPSLAENPVPSLRTPTPVTTKAETTLLSTSAAIVTPSTYFTVCSKLPPDNISSVSSTPVTSTKSELVVTQSISLAEETSTYEPSFPYSLSASENVVSLTTGITETSAIDRIKPLPTSAHKPATSIDIHTSQSSTHQVDAQVSTQLETGPSTLSSDEEQMITSPGKTPRTMEVTEMSPSTNCFIFYSQGISTLEMSDAGFFETPQISSHQTHSSSEIPLGTPPNGDSVSSSIPGSPQTIPILTSSNTVDVHLSEMYTSHRKTALPSQDLTIITLLHPEKESARALSTHTPRTMETVVSSTPVTQPISFHLDTSFVDTTTSRTTRISNSVNINTILSHFLSLRTQPGMISVAPSISESTHTFPKPLSPSTTRVSNANFTVITTDGTSSALSIPNVPTTLLGKASKTTFNPIYQMSSLPVNITFLTSKQVSRTTDMLMTKSSKTTHTGCLKSSSIDTSGPVSEMPSVSVNDSTFSSTTVSSDTSSSAGSSSILLSSITPSTIMTIQTSALDVTPLAYAGPTSKSTMTSSAFTASETTEVSSRITAEFLSFSTEPNFPSVKTIPMSTVTEIVTPFVDITASSLLSYKNTEAISSIPKTKFSPLQSTTQQSSPTDEVATAGMLPGIANSSLSTLSNGRITAQRSTYSTMAVLESVLSPTPSDNLHTSLNFQVSPPSSSLTSFKNTPGPTKNIKGATYTTGKMNSLLENTFTAELPKSATSVNIPVSYPPWIPSSATPTSWASFSYSPHSTETEFSITNTFSLLTSEMVELPLLGIIITSNNTQSLPMTLWNTLTTKDFQFPVSTTTYAPTTNKVETEPLSLASGSLSTFTASQMDPVFRDVRTVPSILTLEIFPTFGLSGGPSLSTSSRTNPTTLADIKNTFEKTITSGTPRTTFSSSSSDATSRSIITKVTTPVLTCILPSFPSGPPLTTVSNAPHVINSTTVEGSKSTFRTSDMIPAHPFANFTTLPFVTKSILLSKTTPTHTMGDITTSVPIFLPMSTKVTDDSVCISTPPEALPRTTVSADHRTLSQSPFFSTMRISPSTTDYPLSFGSMHLPSPTITSAWSRIPAASASRTSIFSKPTPDSPINVTTATFAATGSSFPLISTGETHNSILTVSPLVSSSFETTWMDSTLSSPSTEALTSLIGTKCTVSFYNVEMSFSIFDEEPRILISSLIHEFAEDWLNSIFQDSEFSLANLAIQIKNRDTCEEEMAIYQAVREWQRMATSSHVPYSCVSQVIMKANSSLAPRELIGRIRSKVHGNRKHGNFTQDELTLLVKSEHVAVRKLEPGKCKAKETASKYKGTYKWLLTNPTETAQTRCIKNEDGSTTRICSISIDTGKSQWEEPKFKQYKLLQGLPDKILDLANITVSEENANDVAEHILNLLNKSPPLDEEETKIIVSKVSDISLCEETSMNLTQLMLQIINAVLEKQNDSASDLHEVSNEILRLIERAGHKMEFWGRTANLMVARLALAVLRVDHKFEGVTFSIRSYTEGTDSEIYLGDVPPGKVLASIYLPKSLKKRLRVNNLQTILFNFFGQTSLFKYFLNPYSVCYLVTPALTGTGGVVGKKGDLKALTLTGESDMGLCAVDCWRAKNVSKALTTYVVSASISDMSIQNLADPVVITLQHVEGRQKYDQAHCAFWDFEKNDGLGGWNLSGCKVKETNVNYTICQCDHLTHFGVLMDLSRSTVDAMNERILVLITHTGCGISSIFLGITMMTYIIFHKLRKDYPSKILINLCTALLMLNLSFLVNSWLSSFQKVGLCITAAVVLHYFLLASLTWMGLEAVHMYFALVKVFNIYIPNYILKFCLVGWGIPAITVAIILSVRKDLYGILSPATPFCWIKDDSNFYISVVAYFCLIFLLNFSMFCTVLAQLNFMKLQSRKTQQKRILHDLKGTTSLTFLLGLTWGFAFFAWGPVRIFFLYLFAIFNTFQGFLIFVFYCVMKESVREQWQILLCCGRLRLDNCSDGSSRYGINVGYKQKRMKKTSKHRLLTASLNSTATSSTYKSLGSAQGIPLEINFPNDDIGEDPYGFSPLSCEAIPSYVRRMLPAELKMSSTHKEKCALVNLSMDTCFPPPTDWGKC